MPPFEGIDENTDTKVNSLVEKHPKKFPIEIEMEPFENCFFENSVELKSIIKTFARGLPPNLSVTRPEHIENAVDCPSSTTAELTINEQTVVFNLLVSGKVNSQVRTNRSPAKLIGLKNNYRGERPTIIGKTV